MPINLLSRTKLRSVDLSLLAFCELRESERPSYRATRETNGLFAMPRSSALGTLTAVLSLAAAIPVHLGADRHRRLQDSIQECRDGHDGFLVELSPSALL